MAQASAPHLDSSPMPELASRLERLGAAIIDVMISVLVGVLLAFFSGAFMFALDGRSLPPHYVVGLGILGFILHIVIHGYFLRKYGQTVGKRLVGIQIVDMNNRILSLEAVVVFRLLPVSAVSFIDRGMHPLFGWNGIR